MYVSSLQAGRSRAKTSSKIYESNTPLLSLFLVFLSMLFELHIIIHLVNFYLNSGICLQISWGYFSIVNHFKGNHMVNSETKMIILVIALHILNIKQITYHSPLHTWKWLAITCIFTVSWFVSQKLCSNLALTHFHPKVLQFQTVISASLYGYWETETDSERMVV